ncbi:MAG: glycosyl transferase family 28 [Duncaniella sp.]|nr:glycosyl transferase family 28 [Duncaniella sp.]
MIFATTGVQLPFDRFVRILDDIAGSIDEKIVAQFLPDKYVPANLKVTGFISPIDFDEYVQNSRIVVAHAGMGSIISALNFEKPVIVMPRQSSVGEHRNDHQIATAIKMAELGYVFYAHDKEELKALLTAASLPPLKKIASRASDRLTNAILNEINYI